jgi:hypothetical protein
MVINNSISHLWFSRRWIVMFIMRQCRMVDGRNISDHDATCIFREAIRAGEKWVDVQKLGEENQKTRIRVALYYGRIGFDSGLG